MCLVKAYHGCLALYFLVVFLYLTRDFTLTKGNTEIMSSSLRQRVPPAGEQSL